MWNKGRRVKKSQELGGASCSLGAGIEEAKIK